MAIIHWSGAIVGLAIAIILILKKVNPVYALFGGAIIGGFVTVSVIIAAPIALSVAKKAGLTKSAILLAMIGGAMCIVATIIYGFLG